MYAITGLAFIFYIFKMPERLVANGSPLENDRNQKICYLSKPNILHL